MVNITTLSGITIGQYTLKDQMGAGGMGVVYRAWQPNLEREVAVKILPPMLASQEGYIERFIREAKTSAALEHAHIVPIYDYGTQQDLSYVVMRLLTGGSLAQRITQRKDVSEPAPNEIARMLKDIADALDYAHTRGVIHRDIKAGNIMFDSHGSAYLVDFGIAKLKDNLGLTSSGLAVGTPTHMSPEQWRGDDVTPATDQYALGVVMYELITGKLPFDSNTAYALMHKHLNEPPTPLGLTRPDLPSEVGDVLQQAMAKDPADRFPTARAFADAFEKAIRGTADSRSTQFFTFPVEPIRLKADGELYSAMNISQPSVTPGSTKAKRDFETPEIKDIRKTVQKRINKRRELYMHAAMFCLIIPMLWMIWIFVGADIFPFPLVVMLGWGAGLVAHAIDVFYESGGGDRIREREFRRELEQRGIDMDARALLEYDQKAKQGGFERLVENLGEEIEEFFEGRRERRRHDDQ